jgi:transposase
MKEKETETRYVGIDLGKRTYEIAVVEGNGKVKFSNGSTYVAARQVLYHKLRRQDKVAIEAGNMAFVIAKEIKAVVGCQVYVLNASQLAVIYASMKKTDKQDSLKLAHILQDFQEDRLPVVPVPSDKEMERRKLIAGSRRAHQYRNRSICQLHGLFLAQGITTITKENLATHERRREAVKKLTDLQLEEASYLLDCLFIFEHRIKSLDKKIEEESVCDEQIEKLKSIPGVGPKTAFAFAAHVAAERFENAGQVSNYLGLVPRVYMSGNTVRYGRITKRGNGYVRALLVQASWALVRSGQGGQLKKTYIHMTQENSISKKKAIVAIARRLAELMYTLMRDGTRYEPTPLMSKQKTAEELATLAMSA